jgi:hypothetical protein
MDLAGRDEVTPEELVEDFWSKFSGRGVLATTGCLFTKTPGCTERVAAPGS